MNYLIKSIRLPLIFGYQKIKRDFKSNYPSLTLQIRFGNNPTSEAKAIKY